MPNFQASVEMKVSMNLNLIEDYKDEKDVLYYCTDDSVAMVFS